MDWDVIGYEPDSAHSEVKFKETINFAIWLLQSNCTYQRISIRSFTTIHVISTCNNSIVIAVVAAAAPGSAPRRSPRWRRRRAAALSRIVVARLTPGHRVARGARYCTPVPGSFLPFPFLCVWLFRRQCIWLAPGTRICLHGLLVWFCGPSDLKRSAPVALKHPHRLRV